MENLAKRVVLTLILYMIFGVIALGFGVTALVFGFKSLLAVLIPEVGYAWAYLICSGICVGLILLTYVLVRQLNPMHREHTHTHTEEGKSPNAAVEHLSVLIRENPFEAVALAFSAGFASEYSGEFRQALAKAGSKALK